MQRNIQTIKAQLDVVEQKLGVSEHISRPEIRDEGLPVTDIREELDDEGNVICKWQDSLHGRFVNKRCTAGTAVLEADSTPRIVEALRKAGVNDLPDTSRRKKPLTKSDRPKDWGEDREPGERPHPKASELVVSKQVGENENPASTTNSSHSDSERMSAAPLARKKSVSFAEGTKTEDSKISRKRQPNPLFAKSRSPPAIATAETILDVQHKKPSDQLTALLNAEANVMRSSSTINPDARITSPVLPRDESPEDAALRREMLQYNMQEVGAVVAEMDLDDDISTPPYSEDEDEDDTSVEEEDEHGRSTNIVLSDEYIKQMKALEKRLNASMIENVGPITTSENSSLPQKVKSNIIIAKPDTNNTAPSKGPPTKAVRFAADHDIQEVPVQDENPTPSAAPALADGATSDKSAPAKTRVSRFTSARNMRARSGSDTLERAVPNISVPTLPKRSKGDVSEKQTCDISTGPPNRPHADTVIERPFPSQPDGPPPGPDEFDPELLHKEVTTQYHRQRNRMIYRQGGFLPKEEEDEAEVPVDENGNEEGRKVSRFMAARLGRRGD